VLKQAQNTLITALLDDFTSQKCSHFRDGVGVLRKRNRKRAELRELQQPKPHRGDAALMLRRNCHGKAA